MISDPQKVDAFIDAIEASIADSRPKPNVSLNDVLMTENDIIKMHNLRKRMLELKNEAENIKYSR